MRVWKRARHPPHITQLNLRVAELIKDVQVPLERAADLLDVTFGDERAEQFDGREEPAGLHPHVMNRVFGKPFLAALQPFAIVPPLRVQRIAKVLQHISGLNRSDV